MTSMCATWSLVNSFYGNCRPPTADAFESTMAIRCAEDTGTVCAYVKQVPNQPIVFYVSTCILGLELVRNKTSCVVN